MAKATPVAVKDEPRTALPAHLQQRSKARIGNVDSSDLIIPRVKLIQAISPEVTEFDAAKAGEFWHTLAEVSLGKELRAVPIITRKSYALWAPRNDTRGILARANDAIHWDQPNTKFRVKPKGSANEVEYNTGSDVPSSGLADFGSSIPGDPKSKPAASLTYNFLWYLLDFPELSPAVIINTRSAVKPAKNLLAKIDMRPVDHYYQIYTMGSIVVPGEEGPYNNYSYRADGYVEDPDQAELLKGLYERFNTADWRANAEEGDTPEDGGGSEKPRGNANTGKF